MVKIDELNTVSLEMLNRFGDRDVSVDVSLFRLSINLIVSRCHSQGHALDEVLLDAVRDISAVPGPAIHQLEAIRKTTVSSKSMDELVNIGANCEQYGELLHFALFNESSQFLGDDECQLDFWFVRELISIAVTTKYNHDEEELTYGDMADAVFLADVLVQWAQHDSSENEHDLENAISMAHNALSLVEKGIHRYTEQKSLADCLPASAT